MPEITSDTMIEALKRILNRNYAGKIYDTEAEMDTILECLALGYAVEAIKERDEVYSNIDSLLDKVRSWKK